MRIGKGHSYYVDNLALFKEPNNRTNEAVQARIAALKKKTLFAYRNLKYVAKFKKKNLNYQFYQLQQLVHFLKPKK